MRQQRGPSRRLRCTVVTRQPPHNMPDRLSEEPVTLIVEPAQAGWRLDLFLVHHFPEYSRGHLRRVISAGGVRVDDGGGKPSYRLKPGQVVRAVLPEIPREAPTPEAIPLDVLYEDDWLAVVNKPAAMVVHPARGNWSGTLASALQHRFAGKLSSVGGPTRPGIVHRLDRDTSGVILVAKHDLAHSKLAVLFQDRQIEKEYYAIVLGAPERDRDVIEQPIGTHPTQREKMAIRRHHPQSKAAETFYEVDERFDGYAAVKVLPKTGRTHQIRVHLCHIGHPILCDRQYGGHSQITRGELSGNREEAEVLLDRQALHARRLKFVHPQSAACMEVVAPLPGDMSGVLEALRSFKSARR